MSSHYLKNKIILFWYENGNKKIILLHDYRALKKWNIIYLTNVNLTGSLYELTEKCKTNAESICTR